MYRSNDDSACETEGRALWASNLVREIHPFRNCSFRNTQIPRSANTKTPPRARHGGAVIAAEFLDGNASYVAEHESMQHLDRTS